MALKTFTGDISQLSDHERRLLFVIYNLDDPHLVKPIASYRYKGEESTSFLFPWADGGTLREFWTRERTKPLEEPRMMSWILNQLKGLCHALNALHQEGCWHGDVKAENIYVFKEDEYMGTLRIANVGQAEWHAMRIEQRVNLLERAGTNTATLRYVSPEFVHTDYIQLISDVWALGCVFLEFLIWILYGQDGLNAFNAMEFDRYWSESDGRFSLHARVQSWVDLIARDLADEKTAFLSLLNLIRLRMLVVDQGRRSSSYRIHRELDEICWRAEHDEDYALYTRMLRTLPPPQLLFSKDSTHLEGPGPVAPRQHMETE